MNKQLGISVILTMMIFGWNMSLQAQFDQTVTKDNTQRSIWDKEPETKTAASPYGSATQPLGAAQMQQNGTLADPPGFGTNTMDGVPIDGGLSFLLAAGVGYGVRKIRRSKRKQMISRK